ncbi:hypothetical protein [Actinomadura roseirufa]|uniref:hypothetical protein n=1 Tax=Actinomadura roseirufa TaxID=2094049 RepID=UPI001040E3A6|nr:hypothetical protein [Actinomadura roseirufa]
MEPTSMTFLVLVCGAAVACVAAVVVLWPRVAGTGHRALLTRSGMLVAAQASLTTVVVLLANSHFVFYATWNDLFGSDVVKVKVNQVQPSRGEDSKPSDLVHHATTDLAPRRRDGHEHGVRRDGRVDRLEIRGPRSGLNAEAYVYLPPQYFQPAYAKKRLPVLVLISGGASDDKMAWLRQARLPEEVGRAEPKGRIQPLVYVMLRSARGLTPTPPSPGEGPGKVSGGAAGRGAPHGRSHGARNPLCIDAPGRPGGQPEAFFAQDLPLALAGAYPGRLPETRKGWGVAGFATGGHCAARLAMLHSDRFIAAASINGQFNTPTDGGTAAPAADPYGASRPFRLDNDLLWRLEHVTPPPVAVLTAASSDGTDAQQAERFVALAKPPMSAEKTVFPGNLGTLKQWRFHLAPILEWLSAHLRGE